MPVETAECCRLICKAAVFLLWPIKHKILNSATIRRLLAGIKFQHALAADLIG